MKTCTFNDCNNIHDSHGFCANHARQYRKYGHPLSKEEVHERLSNAASKRKQTLDKTWKIDPAKREAMVGRRTNTGRTHFKKGHRPTHTVKGWVSDEHKEALRIANIGRIPWNKGTKGLMPRPHNKIGEGITPKTKLERDKFRKTIVDLVFARDNYTCAFCDQFSGHLHVDHIKAWADYPELRFELDNCRTLCRTCHYYITFKRKMPSTSKWGLTTMTRERG